MSVSAQSKWKFDFTNEADGDLGKLDSSVRRRVLERLGWFREHFQEVSLLPLTSDWKGFFKFRVGDWRVIYEIEREER